MHPLLDLAEELERRDARVAGQLETVERLQAEVDELRAHAAAAQAFLEALPAAIEQHVCDERAAEEDEAVAAVALREAEEQAADAKREHERLLAERAAQRARDALADAGRRAERAREHQQALGREGAERRDEAERLERRASALQPGVRDVAPPAAGLDGVLAWASQAHGALIVEHSGLVRERDAVVREASELLSSALGDPLAATSAAGLRDRLSRALA